jgi:hypothetical protein
MLFSSISLVRHIGHRMTCCTTLTSTTQGTDSWRCHNHRVNMEMDLLHQRACRHLHHSSDAFRLAKNSDSRKDIMASARRDWLSTMHCSFGSAGLRAPASWRWSLRLVISNRYRYTHRSGGISHGFRLLDMVSLQWNTILCTAIPGQDCPPQSHCCEHCVSFPFPIQTPTHADLSAITGFRR